MKILFTYSIVISLILSCATTSTVSDASSLEIAIERVSDHIKEKLPSNTRIAILNFDTISNGLSVYIMDEITGALVNRNISVSDRSNLEYIYKELDFQMSGYVSDETAQSIGKFWGAQSVITGELIDAGNSYRLRVNVLNVETARHEISVRLNVRKDRNFSTLVTALDRNTKASRYTSDFIYNIYAPQFAGDFFDRGISRALQGNFESAIEAFTDAIKLDPFYMAAFYQRGKSLVASVSNVIGFDDDFDNYYDVVDVNSEISENKIFILDRAIADFTQALTLDPIFARIYYHRGRAYNAKIDYAKAIADFNQVIRLDPNYPWAYNDLGVSYYSIGDKDRAFEAWTTTIRLDPNNNVAYNNRGNIYYERREYDKAIDDFTRAININQNYFLAYNGRAFSYMEKDDFNKALADCNKLISLNSNYAPVYFTRCIVYFQMGDLDRAIRDINVALNIEPNNVAFLINRGFLHYHKSDFNNAINDMTNVLKLDPNNTDAKNLIKEIRKVRGY